MSGAWNVIERYWYIFVVILAVGLTGGFIAGSYNAAHNDVLNAIETSTQRINQSIETHTAGLATEIQNTRTKVEEVKAPLTEIGTKVNDIDTKTTEINATFQAYNSSVFLSTTIWISVIALVVSVAVPVTLNLLRITQNINFEKSGHLLVGLLAGITVTLILHFVLHIF